MKLKAVVFIVFSVLFIYSCKPTVPSIHFHKSHETNKQNTPFSDVVESHGFLFLSGQLGMNHKTRKLVEGGIEAETRQAIENIKAVLEHHGLSLNEVVKCTVILKDMQDFAVFNSIYAEYFPHKPARTTFAAAGLALNASIEIDVTASR